MVKKISPEERFESVLESGVDFAKRRIYLTGDVGPEMSRKAIIALHALEDTNHKLITVYLDTGGGDEYEGWAMYDAFKAAQSKIMIIGMGQVMSMGAALLQMASPGMRILTKNTRFMIHNGQGPTLSEPHSSVLKAMGREQEVNDARYAEILAGPMVAVTGNSAWLERVKEMCLKEAYFSAQEAVDHGFADMVKG